MSPHWNKYNDAKPKDKAIATDTLLVHTIITTKVKIAKRAPPLSRGTNRKQDILSSLIKWEQQPFSYGKKTLTSFTKEKATFCKHLE